MAGGGDAQRLPSLARPQQPSDMAVSPSIAGTEGNNTGGWWAHTEFIHLIILGYTFIYTGVKDVLFESFQKRKFIVQNE